jgi:hypothetical protein
MAWTVINNDPPEGCWLIEYRDIYDGGLFWYDPKEMKCYKRWNDEFYRDRCPDIDKVIEKWIETKKKEKRFYPLDVVEEALKEYFKEREYLKITNRINEDKPEAILMQDIVGYVKKDDIYCTKKYLKLRSICAVTKVKEALPSLIEKDAVEITPFGYGKFTWNKDVAIINHYELFGLQISIKT